MSATAGSFQFVAASYLIRIRPERAWSLSELGLHLRSVPPASVSFHTFQSLESHHYTVFSNDFAQWAATACNETLLGEELAAIDIRDFVSLEDLRNSLVETLERYLTRFPHIADRPGFEPFFFCESVEFALPLGRQASNLEELAAGIRNLSRHSLHYHFINSRIRLQLKTNDFSHWIDNSLQQPALAEALNRIDFYTNTLEGVRTEILETIERWM
ncbi:MAG TPA: DUF5752 family protein [Terriglobia bacterium]|nr:DUF5752 family protein [Terriglobia bacterium]